MRQLLLAFACFAATIPAATAGVQEVNVKLPLKPRVAVSGGETLALAPFVIALGDADDRHDRAAKIDVQAEFQRYLRKQIAKSTKLKIVTASSSQLPGSDMKALEADRDFWRGIADRTGADYVVSGVIDFDIEDKSGYRHEEYVSPIDGRTYIRQVLIESTGFVFDIIVAIFDGETGEKLVEENFRDFKEFDQRNYDEILGLFENLRSLEAQLLSIFVAQETSASRYLFSD